MNRRRFMLLAISLVAVNTFFWLAQGGFALPRAVINSFFGSRMVRAEVIVANPDGTTEDWLIDRGVIVANTPTSVSLRERDGRVVTVDLDPNARVQGPLRISSVAQLRRRLRVVVYHQANAPAEIVQVEGIGG